MQKYIFIDTNLWIRYISQGQPGCEEELLEYLIEKINDRTLTLLMPEIVLLEIQKSWRSFREDIRLNIAKIEKVIEGAFKDKNLWNEVHDIQSELENFLNKQKDSKLKAVEKRYEKLLSFFKNSYIDTIPLTPEILFLGKKRLIAGGMPKSDNSSHSDACIVESLSGWIKSCGTMSYCELSVCSENESDFGMQNAKGTIIHPTISDALPAASTYFKDLKSFVEFHKTNVSITPPTPTVVEEIINQETKDQISEEDIDAVLHIKDRCSIKGCKNRACIYSHQCWIHHQESVNESDPNNVREWRHELSKILSGLPYKEREILKLRHGLGDGYKYTVEEVAQVFRITSTAFLKVERSALKNLMRWRPYLIHALPY